MVTHILGCLWIFTGNISDFEEFTDNQGNQYNVNWITKNGFDEIRNFQLYTISFYYTVTTIATVGYGDISGTNSTEKYVSNVLMVLGVIMFSLISTAITTII